MGDDGRVHAMEDDEAAAAEQIQSIDIYPLSNYFFGSKEALLFKDETLADRVQRMKSKYIDSIHFNLFRWLYCEFSVYVSSFSLSNVFFLDVFV